MQAWKFGRLEARMAESAEEIAIVEERLKKDSEMSTGYKVK